MLIDIYYALERDAIKVTIRCDEGTSITGVVSRAVELPASVRDNLHRLQLSSYGKRLAVDDTVKPGMRIEILRPLLITPTEARRIRASRGLDKLDKKKQAR